MPFPRQRSVVGRWTGAQVGRLDPSGARLIPACARGLSPGQPRPLVLSVGRRLRGAGRVFLRVDFMRSGFTPAIAGLAALTPAPRTLARTGSCPTMPNHDPLHVVVDDLSTLTQYDQRRVMTSDRRRDGGGRGPVRVQHGPDTGSARPGDQRFGQQRSAAVAARERTRTRVTQAAEPSDGGHAAGLMKPET